MHFPNRIRLPHNAYANRELRVHVTFRTHPEVGALSEPLAETIWKLVLDERHLGRIELFAACLMPDHAHMLLRPSGMDVLRFLNVFKSWSTRSSWQYGHHGALWQPGMWDRSIRDQSDFDATTDYIVRNLQSQGLVEDWHSWPWTWAYFLDS